ncbi:MAG: hydrolase [Gemmatimonadetes bacterium]|nr:hydrolase [Gemmatimonadota bacterium]
MLTNENTVLTLVDIQEKLIPVMHDKKFLINQLKILIQGAAHIGLPILWLEQYPKGLGPTIPELTELLPNNAPIAKSSFSAYGSEEFRKKLQTFGRPNVLIAGIESHICVYQTTRDLLNEGYQVEIVVDAMTSRTKTNHDIGLERMKQLGASFTSVEMSLFELVRTAKSAIFKRVANIVK